MDGGQETGLEEPRQRGEDERVQRVEEVRGPAHDPAAARQVPGRDLPGPRGERDGRSPVLFEDGLGPHTAPGAVVPALTGFAAERQPMSLSPDRPGKEPVPALVEDRASARLACAMSGHGAPQRTADVAVFRSAV